MTLLKDVTIVKNYDYDQILSSASSGKHIVYAVFFPPHTDATESEEKNPGSVCQSLQYDRG